MSAVKHGRLLILEGIEKAERGIMPVRHALPHTLDFLSQKAKGSQQFAGES